MEHLKETYMDGEPLHATDYNLAMHVVNEISDEMTNIEQALEIIIGHNE